MTSALAALEATAAELGAQSTAEASTLRRLSQKAADALAIAEAKRAEASGTKDKAARIQLEEEAEAEDAKEVELEAERAAAEAQHEVESKYQEVRSRCKLCTLSSPRRSSSTRAVRRRPPSVRSSARSTPASRKCSPTTRASAARCAAWSGRRSEPRRRRSSSPFVTSSTPTFTRMSTSHITSTPGRAGHAHAAAAIFGDRSRRRGSSGRSTRRHRRTGRLLRSPLTVSATASRSMRMPRVASVAIHRIEFGDQALPLGRCSRTRRTRRRTWCSATDDDDMGARQALWVNEHRLKKVKHGHDPHTRRAQGRVEPPGVGTSPSSTPAKAVRNGEAGRDRAQLQNGDLDPKHALARLGIIPLRYQRPSAPRTLR